MAVDDEPKAVGLEVAAEDKLEAVEAQEPAAIDIISVAFAKEPVPYKDAMGGKLARVANQLRRNCSPDKISFIESCFLVLLRDQGCALTPDR